MEQIEFLILKNLIHNEKYLRKSIPFIKSEYFEDPHQKMVYEEIFSFVESIMNFLQRKYCQLKLRREKILMKIHLKVLLI